MACAKVTEASEEHAAWGGLMGSGLGGLRFEV